MINRGPDDETVLVTFELPAAVGAHEVHVCGDFNDWSPTAHPLTRLEDGRFRITLELPAGRRWHFRYLLDGHRWENDWAADDYEPNAFGGQDSILDLTGRGSATA
jgi:1,4-alpha-glucan branching enzyme